MLLSLLAAALASASSAPACAHRLPHAPAGLPAPVVLTTTCAKFTIEPDGSVSSSALAPLPTTRVPNDGHVTLRAGGRVVWRSARRYRLYDVVVQPGPRALALGYRGRLYIAERGRPERPVGRGTPIGWTRRGALLAVRFRGRATDIAAHDAAGRQLRVVGRDVRTWSFDRPSATLVYIDRSGTVVRTDGRVVTRLHRVRELGLGAATWAQPLAGALVALLDGKRLVVLRPDGSVLGRTRAAGRRVALAAGGPPVAGAGGVAFAVTRGYTGYRTRGTEDVQLIRADGSHARLLHRRLRFALCERGSDLSWHGRWLLYRATEGPVVAVDTATGRAVDLSRFAARLPGFVVDGQDGADLRAQWEGPLAAPPV